MSKFTLFLKMFKEICGKIKKKCEKFNKHDKTKFDLKLFKKICQILK